MTIIDKIKDLLRMLAENIHKRRRVVLALSCVVVFVTTYMLILPAFTLEKTKAAEQGGIDVPGVTTTAEDVSGEDADANDGQADAQDVQSESGKTEDGKVEDSGSQSKDSDEANADASAEDPLTFKDEHYTIAVDDKNSVLPENTEIKVEEIDKDKDAKKYEKHFDDALAAIQEEKDGENVSDLEFARFYDISLVSDGKEVTLGNGDKVSVNIEYDKELRKALGVENKDNIRIIHFAENKDTGKVEAEVLDNKEAKVEVNTDKKDQLKEASFEAESFSVYAVVYTVDFEYEVDGNKYTYSLKGGDSISLRELLPAIGLTTKDEVGNYIETIDEVSFTDKKLVNIAEVREDKDVTSLIDLATGLDEDFTVKGSKTVKQDPIHVTAPDWIITSLAPFTSNEELIIVTKDGVKHTVKVTDEQHDPSAGEWALEHQEGADAVTSDMSAKVSNTVTSTPQSRNATFSVDVAFAITDQALEDMQGYIDGYPKLTYDLTDWLAANPVDLNTAHGKFRSGNTTVGVYDIVDGKVILTFTNLAWLKQQKKLEGEFTLKLTVDEEKLGSDDSWEFRLPGTDDDITITFKDITYNTTKTASVAGRQASGDVYVVQDEDGNYYVDYTATFTTPASLESLKFIDTYSNNQQLVGNVTVTSPTGQTLSTQTSSSSNGFNVDITAANGEKLSAGTYTVKYRTKLTAEAVQQLEGKNYKTDDPVTNDSSWKVDGNKDVDGPETSFQPKKEPPKPEPPKKTVNGKSGDAGEFTYGGTLNYEITYGTAGVSLAGVTIVDNMSTLQNLEGDVTIVYGDGSTQKMPVSQNGWENGNGVVWNSPNEPTYTGFKDGSAKLFDYTFPADTTKEGPITIRYSTKVVSKDVAENTLNLFGTKDIRNTVAVGNDNSWTVGHLDTQEPTEIKKTIVNNNGSEEYKPGDTVTYTVEYGKAGQDMSGVVLYDEMSDIQKVSSDIQIAFGDGSTDTVSSGNPAYKWNDDSQYSSGNTNVLEYTVPQGKTGVITVTYTATIITEEEANHQGIWDTQPLNNHASTSKGGDADTHKDVDFGKKPKPEVDKTFSNPSRADGENWQPGDTINWTVTYTLADKDMNGMVLEDYMKFVQKYNGDATISINDGQFANMPASAIKYNSSDTNYSKDREVLVYQYTVNENEPVHKVVIKYSTTIISEDEALKNNVTGTIYAGNRGVGEGNSDYTGHDTDFPHVPVEKDVTAVNGTDSIDGENWQPGDTVTYHLTYGADGMQLNNAWVYDKMTDVQILVGDVVITYKDENGQSHSFNMPNAADNNNSGVRYNDDGYYSNNMVDLFDYRLPLETSEYGKIYGPITITYNARIIDADKASEMGIGGSTTVENDFNTSVGADNTTGIVPYPSKDHDGTISKTGYVDADGNPVYGVSKTDIPEGVEPDVSVADQQVTWHIRVEAEEGSSYPLTDVSIQDDRGNYHQDTSSGNEYGNTGNITDFASAVIKTDSGITLTPGADYTFDPATKTWFFKEIAEPITIELTSKFNHELVGEYAASNHVYLRYGNKQKESESEVEGKVTDIVVNKTGVYDPDSRTITWTVVLNPKWREYTPDINKVIFKDDLPEGLSLVNYNDGTTDNPSIYVKYLGMTVQNDKNQEIVVEQTGKHFEADITSYTYDQGKLTWMSLADAKLQSHDGGAIFWGNKGLKWYSFEDIEAQGGNHVGLDLTGTAKMASVGINKQKYEIVYKTIITDEEWNEITNSETGSKTYENSALFTDGKTASWSGTGEETVKMQSPIHKFEMQEDDYGGGFHELKEDDHDRLYWYQIEVNPEKAQLNRGEPLKLADRIDTKIDIVPTSIQILDNSSGAPVDTMDYEDGSPIKPVVKYNDDTRMMTVENLQDSTSYIIRYQVRVRAVYTDEMDDPNSLSYHEYIITNSATLEGAGTWTDVITREHKAQVESVKIRGGIKLTKIDENDATKIVPGAVFELHKLDTGVVITTDEDGKVTDIDTSGIKDNPVDEQVLDYKRDIDGNVIGEDGDGDGSLYTYTTDSKGELDFGQLEPNTLYYWIETGFPEGYLGDRGEKHYFVIYYEDKDSSETTTQNMHSAWELDNIWTRQYGITVASISDGTTWVANNSRTRSLAVTKRWADDYNNVYKTRPDSVKVNLIQIDYKGNRRVYDSTVMRISNDGNWQAYTNYVWNTLPSHDEHNNPYTYTVEEEHVQGYVAVYDPDNQTGQTGGTVTITNKLIPSKTNIFVEKKWEDGESDERPDYIEVQLMQIATDSDGNVSNPKPYPENNTPVRIMPDKDGKWTYSWSDLPTKDGEGGTYTYTVKELNVPEGYVVTYSDNEKGILSSDEENPLTITNTSVGSLEISKTLVGIDGSEMTQAQREAIEFKVTDKDGNVVASCTYQDLFENNGKHIFENMPVGTYTVTETGAENAAPEDYVFVGTTFDVKDGEVTVIKGEKSTVSIENEYKGKKPYSFRKIWVGSDITNWSAITSDNRQEWSEDKSIEVELRRSVGNNTDNSFKLNYTINSGDETVQPTNTGLTDEEKELYSLHRVESGKVYTFSIDSVLDAKDANGNAYTYYVTEVSAGEGDIQTYYGTVDDDNTVTKQDSYSKAMNGEVIINAESNGVELPMTGGIGTTIFYILGSILVIGGGIYFISRRRAMK